MQIARLQVHLDVGNDQFQAILDWFADAYRLGNVTPCRVNRQLLLQMLGHFQKKLARSVTFPAYFWDVMLG
ncbi:MAG: hypothetical protein OIF56_13635 [Cohaesibacter sp.]|nr:hypothetical protein [Cohaesibacter sp.]